MQGVTVAVFNVDSAQNDNEISEERRKRQIDSDNQPTHLYIAFETKGEEPVNVNFTATQREDIFVPPTTTSTPEPEPPTTTTFPELESPTTTTSRIVDTVSLFCIQVFNSMLINLRRKGNQQVIIIRCIPSLFSSAKRSLTFRRFGLDSRSVQIEN